MADSREYWYTSPEIKKLVGMLASDDVKGDPVARPNRSVTIRAIIIDAARNRFGDHVVDAVLAGELSSSRQ